MGQAKDRRAEPMEKQAEQIIYWTGAEGSEHSKSLEKQLQKSQAGLDWTHLE